jgi:hypothetical protein
MILLMADPAIDPHLGQDGEPDLEAQVEGLLSDMMDTVEDINRKLQQEARGEPEIDPSAALGDDGLEALLAQVTGEGGAAGDAEGAAEQALTGDTDLAGSTDPEGEPDPVPGVEAVQAELEAALAEETQTEPLEESPAEAQADPVGEAPEAAAAEPVAEVDDEADGAYGDAESLDDELAALASHALDDDEFAGDFETPAFEGPVGPVAEEPPVEEAQEATEPVMGGPEAVDSAGAEPVVASAAVAATPPKAAHREAPAPRAAPSGALKWGWLPPKPAWEPVYSKWRLPIFAWRHAVWVVPPFVSFVMRMALARARQAEPSVRHAVAVAASPLSKRDAKVRSAVGYLAVWTLFWAVCLWVYVLVARAPTAPPAAETPTTLVGSAQQVAAGQVAP